MPNILADTRRGRSMRCRLEPFKGQHFMRPLGGRIEFGERAIDALRREIREELHAEVDQSELLGVLASVFVYAGARCHEIVFVFDAGFQDRSFYDLSEIPIAEDVWLGPAKWQHLGSLGTAGHPCIPMVCWSAHWLAHPVDGRDMPVGWRPRLCVG